MTSEEILAHYYDAATDGPRLLVFVQTVLDGRYGPPDRQALIQFLDRLEIIISGNIDDRIDEGPGLGIAADQVRDAASREINEARTLVLDAWRSDGG